KVEQGIIQEVISFIQKEAFASSFNTSKFNIVIADGEGRDLAQLFSDAEFAEGKTIKAKQKE
ncbi:17505_t:CDS:1, partial [Racocetra persica]